MTKTIVGLYNDFDNAREAVEDLVEAGFSRTDISIVANNANGESAQGTDGVVDADDVTAGQGARFGAVVGGLIGLGALLIPGIGPVIAAGPLAAVLGAGVGAAAGAATGGITASLVKTGIPEEEANYYAEGIRRGGALVSVNVPDEHVEHAEQILEEHDPVNVTEQASTAQTTAYSTEATGSNGFRNEQRTVNAGEEARLDVVEEELQVGKREVERGGVRVRTYVTETPVQEDIQLREEHVTVERHPVNRVATSADLETFEEGVIELTERGEEAVVQKTARVVEEVVVGKEVEHRTETIQDSVRRKDVVVEDIGASSTATAGTTSWDTYANDFRTHYTTNYGSSGYTFEQYTPAYRYGYSLANNQQYSDYDWDRLEPQARSEWESRNPDTWDNFKDAVRSSWQRVRGR